MIMSVYNCSVSELQCFVIFVISVVHCGTWQVYYDYYNRKYGSDGCHKSLDWSEYDDKVEGFKRQHIHQHIIDTEVAEMSYL